MVAASAISVPDPSRRDIEDVQCALAVSAARWEHGDYEDALRWLRRAARAAADHNQLERALELSKAAINMSRSLSEPPPVPTPPKSDPVSRGGHAPRPPQLQTEARAERSAGRPTPPPRAPIALRPPAQRSAPPPPTQRRTGPPPVPPRRAPQAAPQPIPLQRVAQPQPLAQQRIAQQRIAQPQPVAQRHAAAQHAAPPPSPEESQPIAISSGVHIAAQPWAGPSMVMADDEDLPTRIRRPAEDDAPPASAPTLIHAQPAPAPAPTPTPAPAPAPTALSASRVAVMRDPQTFRPTLMVLPAHATAPPGSAVAMLVGFTERDMQRLSEILEGFVLEES